MILNAGCITCHVRVFDLALGVDLFAVTPVTGTF
jgi:hypothetical protein